MSQSNILHDLLKSFDLRKAFEESERIFNEKIKHIHSYKSSKASALFEKLAKSTKFTRVQLKELAEMFSIIVDEKIEVIDDSKVELHKGVFIMSEEKYGGIEHGQILFIEAFTEDDKEKLRAIYEESGFIQFNCENADMLTDFSHASFEDVEKMYERLRSQEKVKFITSVLEAQK